MGKSDKRKTRSAAAPRRIAAVAAPIVNTVTEQTASGAAAAEAPGFPACVEHGIWTAIPQAPPATVAQLAKDPTAVEKFALNLKDVDPRQNDAIQKNGAMTFHLVGCSGNFDDHTAGYAVAAAMASQLTNPQLGSINSPARSAAFLYHLGDIAYKPDQKEKYDLGDMVNEQFYRQYTGYNRPIFAVAGNHDGKNPTRPDGTPDPHKSSILHFLTNFCDPRGRKSPDNMTDNRHAMTQPYIYWRLDTPLAEIVGLYTNIANGGILDDPHQPKGEGAQYRWLAAELKAAARKRKEDAAAGKPRRALLLALHYPPYSGATNFAVRGDPTLGPTLATHAEPLGNTLEKAFAESGIYPDAVFCAHAHLYQRLTYRYANGREIPYLIVGAGGHTIEDMYAPCTASDDSPGTPSIAPAKDEEFVPVNPPGLRFESGNVLEGANFNDKRFGFLRVTIHGNTLTGEYFSMHNEGFKRFDMFDVTLT